MKKSTINPVVRPEIRVVDVALRPAKTNAASLQHVHTSKRGKNERLGLHSWHPYYAAYSEQFVADVIRALAKPKSVILDPWNGSGITTTVAQYTGLRSIGIDINPAMVIHARAKTILPVLDAVRLKQRAKQIVRTACVTPIILPPPKSIIYNFASPKLVTSLLKLIETVKQIQPSRKAHPLSNLVVKGAVDWRRFDSVSSFFLSAIFQCLRKMGNFSYGTNPTWVKPGENGTRIIASEVYDLFLSRVTAMLEDLLTADSNCRFDNQALIIEGDVKATPIRSSSVDLVITSPPYCTRIDYAVSTKPELALLGGTANDINRLRRQTMGAPVILGHKSGVPNNCGRTCLDFISAVENHSSRASKSYYSPIFYQYFTDAISALAEIKRVLRKKAYAVIVVQSSYYKEIEVPLGQIYTEMAKNLGLSAEIAKRETVRQHMAHMNAHSRSYVQDKTYSEDVVLIGKR